jgi:hypothetical protein
MALSQLVLNKDKGQEQALNEAKAREQLELYKQRRPYRDPALKPSPGAPPSANTKAP